MLQILLLGSLNNITIIQEQNVSQRHGDKKEVAQAHSVNESGLRNTQ